MATLVETQPGTILLDGPVEPTILSTSTTRRAPIVSIATTGTTTESETPSTSTTGVSQVVFDPDVHLAYTPPESRLTFEDLKHPAGQGISPVAVTQPFRLFSDEAIREIRREILSKKVVDEYSYVSKLAPFQAREFSERVAPFTHAAWKHPRTMEAISKAAGLDLVPVMDLEIGHTNYQVEKEGQEGIKALNPVPSPPAPPTDQPMPETDLSEDALYWHYDSYPFVCVLMLSDCTTMQGGETAIKCGDGSIIRVRGPTFGSAVMMQGRYLRHAALKAFNAPERITMVTSFRAKDPLIIDGSVLTTIRHISQKNRLNYNWAKYRMDYLSERFAAMAKRLEDMKAQKNPSGCCGTGDPDDYSNSIVEAGDLNQFVQETRHYLEITLTEMMH